MQKKNEFNLTLPSPVRRGSTVPPLQGRTKGGVIGIGRRKDVAI